MYTKSSVTSPANQAQFQRLLRERFGEVAGAHRPLHDQLYLSFGGVADYSLIVDSLAQLILAVELAVANGIEYRLVGAGTNSLVSDVGFPGLLIINRISRVLPVNKPGRLKVDAGTDNRTLVSWAASRGFGGAEFLWSIPGTVAGAIVSNALFQGHGLRSLVKELTVILPAEQIATTVLTDSDLNRSGADIYQLLNIEKSEQTEAFPPVILSVELQLATTQSELILNRLKKLPSVPARLDTRQRVISHIFTTPWRLDSQAQKEFRRLFPGIGLDPTRQVLVIKGQGVNAWQTRQAVEFIEQHSLGEALERRLEFLGYWQDQGGTE